MVVQADCNNFYASCERAFQPKYIGRPVVVLSNNDGCVIARSEEAKALGIAMGTPFHLIPEEIRKQLAVFSSNYTLYADMCGRVMNNLARFTPDFEVYSIDECFFELDMIMNGIPLKQYLENMRASVIQNTGIPVSFGCAPSKTLAKLANKLAKKASGICILQTDEEISAAVAKYPVEDLWGIGRAGHKKLQAQGIYTAGELRAKPIAWIKEIFTIQGVRMWHELWGRPCIPLAMRLDRRKGVCTSRSFGKATGDLEQLLEAAANYTSRVAEKLRQDKSCATVLSVRLITNRFREDLPQYYPGTVRSLTHPINNTPDLVAAAAALLRKIYRPGYQFIKVEIFATGLVPEAEVQLDLFQDWRGAGRDRVSKVMDLVNREYGAGTLRVAADRADPEWAMKRRYMSKPYTTSWSHIPDC